MTSPTPHSPLPTPAGEARSWRCALLLGLLVLVAPVLSAQEAVAPRVELQAMGRPASLVAASLSELLGAQHELAADLLSAGEAGRSVQLILVGAGRESAIQALAHALDCWWAPEAGGGVRYSRVGTLPVVGPLGVQSYSSRLRQRPQLEDEVRRLMAPWLDGERGLVHPPLGRWTATMDPPGQRELEALLTRIERPEIGIPPLLPHPAQPAAHRRLERRLEAADAASLLTALSAATGCSVSLRAGTAPPASRLLLHPAPLHELPLQLAAQGLPAAWIRGVLCVGEDAHDRLHPALRRRWATIPIQHLAAEPLAMTALRARIERDAAPWWWRRPGAGMLVLEEAGLLLLAADDEALAAVLRLLDRLDRQGPLAP